MLIKESQNYLEFLDIGEFYDNTFLHVRRCLDYTVLFLVLSR